MLSHWLASLVDSRKLWRGAMWVLCLALLMILDGLILVRLARRVGVYMALAIEGSTALAALVIVGNSVVYQIEAMAGAAQRGRLRIQAYTRLFVTVAAGVLLILPGLVTDACGVLFLVPPVRSLVAGILAGRYRELLERVDESLKPRLLAAPGGSESGASQEGADEPTERGR